MLARHNALKRQFWLAVMWGGGVYRVRRRAGSGVDVLGGRMTEPYRRTSASPPPSPCVSAIRTTSTPFQRQWIVSTYLAYSGSG